MDWKNIDDDDDEKGRVHMSQKSSNGGGGKSSASSSSSRNGNRSGTSSSSTGGHNWNRKFDDRTQTQTSLTDVEPMPEKQLVRVRSFTTRTGTVVNRGDSFKSRSRRNAQAVGGTPRMGAQQQSGSARLARRRVDADNADDDDDEHVDENNDDGGIDSARAIADWRRPTRRSLPQMALVTEYDDFRMLEHQRQTDELFPVGGVTRSNGLIGGSDFNPEHRFLVPCRQDLLVTANSCGDEEGIISQSGSIPYSVLVLGGPRVGKTTLVQQLLTSEYLANKECSSPVDENLPEMHTTVTVQIDDEESVVRFVDKSTGCTLDVREREPSNCGTVVAPPLSRSRSIVGNDGFLVVYSVTDRSSFRYAQSCLQELRPDKRCNAVILVANKSDVVRNRVVSTSDGARLATRRQCKFIEVSALLDHRIDELLVGIVRQIRLRHDNQVNELVDDDCFDQDNGNLVKSAGNRLVAALSGALNRMLSQARAAAASARGRRSGGDVTNCDGRVGHKGRLRREQVEQCSNLFTP